MARVRQRRLTVTGTMQELVPADRNRTHFVVHNIDENNSVRVYQREDKAEGGIYIWPRQWIEWEKEDAAEEAWYVKCAAGASIYAHVIEFFRKRGP